jgi:hypothetical protein
MTQQQQTHSFASYHHLCLRIRAEALFLVKYAMHTVHRTDPQGDETRSTRSAARARVYQNSIGASWISSAPSLWLGWTGKSYSKLTSPHTLTLSSPYPPRLSPKYSSTSSQSIQSVLIPVGSSRPRAWNKFAGPGARSP